jgi:hypothetical protein
VEDELSDQFYDAMLKLYERMKLAGFRTPRFLGMVQQLGGVEAAKRMVHKRNGTVRFRKLVEERQFKLTVEWLVTRPKWKTLFAAEELQIARTRLKEATSLESCIHRQNRSYYTFNERNEF